MPQFQVARKQFQTSRPAVSNAYAEIMARTNQARAHLPERIWVEPGPGSALAGQLEELDRSSVGTAVKQYRDPIPEGNAPDNGPGTKYHIEAIIIGAIVAISYLNAAIILFR